MRAIDSSVAVAALAGGHVAHESSRIAAGGAAIASHARLETYSVLTRLPPPFRLATQVAADLLDRWFPRESTLTLSTDLAFAIVDECRASGVGGGAVYDALVGLTVREADATLVTRDARAANTYERLGISFEILV